MAGEKVERRLTAILAADVAGYSRLIGVDDEGTRAELKMLPRAKLAVWFGDMGEPQVKNIARPVRAYRARLADGAGRPSIPPETTAPPALLDRPSIAILPFNNVSGDPEQEYFVDGITEDIITALSKWRWFLVIARNSAFAYKGKSVDLKEVGRDLGVRYILEGSMRRAGRRVRITSQLIDTATGTHLWAERYDRDLTDIFAVQDDITSRVAAAIEPALSRAEIQRVIAKRPEHMGAWDYCQRGFWHVNKGTATDGKAAYGVV